MYTYLMEAAYHSGRWPKIQAAGSYPADLKNHYDWHMMMIGRNTIVDDHKGPQFSDPKNTDHLLANPNDFGAAQARMTRSELGKHLASVGFAVSQVAHPPEWTNDRMTPEEIKSHQIKLAGDEETLRRAHTFMKGFKATMLKHGNDQEFDDFNNLTTRFAVPPMKTESYINNVLNRLLNEAVPEISTMEPHLITDYHSYEEDAYKHWPTQFDHEHKQRRELFQSYMSSAARHLNYSLSPGMRKDFAKDEVTGKLQVGMTRLPEGNRMAAIAYAVHDCHSRDMNDEHYTFDQKRDVQTKFAGDVGTLQRAYKFAEKFRKESIASNHPDLNGGRLIRTHHFALTNTEKGEHEGQTDMFKEAYMNVLNRLLRETADPANPTTDHEESEFEDDDGHTNPSDRRKAAAYSALKKEAAAKWPDHPQKQEYFRELAGHAETHMHHSTSPSERARFGEQDDFRYQVNMTKLPPGHRMAAITFAIHSVNPQLNYRMNEDEMRDVQNHFAGGSDNLKAAYKFAQVFHNKSVATGNPELKVGVHLDRFMMTDAEREEHKVNEKTTKKLILKMLNEFMWDDEKDEPYFPSKGPKGPKNFNNGYHVISHFELGRSTKWDGGWGDPDHAREHADELVKKHKDRRFFGMKDVVQVVHQDGEGNLKPFYSIDTNGSEYQGAHPQIRDPYHLGDKTQ